MLNELVRYSLATSGNVKSVSLMEKGSIISSYYTYMVLFG